MPISAEGDSSRGERGRPLKPWQVGCLCGLLPVVVVLLVVASSIVQPVQVSALGYSFSLDIYEDDAPASHFPPPHRHIDLGSEIVDNWNFPLWRDWRWVSETHRPGPSPDTLP